jgi:choline/ethanolamine kinase
MLSSQDYEYASYNPIAFDIANHFCEMTADYHTDKPHILDYSKYPGAWPYTNVLNVSLLSFSFIVKAFSWSLSLTIGLEERQRFLHLYLSSSGINLLPWLPFFFVLPLLPFLTSGMSCEIQID